GGDLSLVVDILAGNDHEIRVGGDQRVQVVHSTALVEETTGNAGARERAAHDLSSVVDGSRIGPGASQRTQVPHVTAAVEKSLDVAIGDVRDSDARTMSIDVVGGRTGTAERAEIQHFSARVQERVANRAGASLGDHRRSNHGVLVIEVPRD